MIACQRWRERRDTYRPAGEPIATRDYEVAPIAEDAVAKAFVLRHHYSASYPAARFRFGLYRRGELAGVAVFSHPCSNAVLARLPGDGLERIELGRFVLLDEVAANGETWFLARAFEGLRAEGIRGVCAFSDPVARTSLDGRSVFPGHVGTIYQAANAAYVGRGSPSTLRLLADGSTLHGRALAKLRARDKGWRYVAARLVAAGADEPGEGDLHGWTDRWLPVLTRPLRHPGNHKFLWALDRFGRRALPVSLPYPKMRLESLFQS